MSTIDPSIVEATFANCLFNDDELPETGEPESFVPAYGVMLKAGFHPQRLEASRETVRQMLSHTSPEFRQGMSFLNFCQDDSGELWTGLQIRCDELITLGVGLGMVQIVMREMQQILPGGVPYIVVNLNGFAGEQP